MMAVYTDVSDDDVECLLADYDIGRVTALKGIAEGVENSNYFLKTDRGEYILTLYERRVREEDLPFFLGLTQHLARGGVPCALPVAKRDGALIHHLHGKPAAIITFLLGTWPRAIRPYHLEPLGTACARMHRAAADFPMRRANPLSLNGWRDLAAEIGGGLDHILPGLAELVAQELNTLETRWPGPGALPRGIIHADLFPDNALFDHERLTGMIDFYFACEDFLAYELAIMVNAWCFTVDGLRRDYVASLIKGYAAIRPLETAELEALPVLARGAALRFLLTRAQDWLRRDASALVAPKNPLEYVRKLQFHQQVTHYQDYGTLS